MGAGFLILENKTQECNFENLTEILHMNPE
jgi:hypothetical protein